MRLPTFLASLVLLACADHAGAQYRCDCTSVVDTCTAEVVARGSGLDIRTDHAQCARVDYFVDGQPFVSVVVDGEDRQDWLARTDNPRIMVQSCQVCRDNGEAAAVPQSSPAPTAATPAADEDAGLEPLIAGVPQYPPAAAARAMRGSVEVEFTVTPTGTVESPRVVAAEPNGVFDQAALTAVARWRYAEDLSRAPQVVRERIEFRPDPAVAATASAAPTSPTGPRNQCVREDAVYNYGEMVDVGLINACNEPLMVFGCAEGTGKNAGRWICSDSEQRGDVLVAAGDRRLGNRYAAGTAADVRTFTYTDSFSVSRAPNSQYWWVACTEGDTGCRADARQWTRAVTGQPARVDPQDRSRVVLARSY